jgi:hypothetical protein
MSKTKNNFLARYGDSDYIDKSLAYGSNDVKHSALKNHLITSSHLDKALDDKEPTVNMAAARHTQATDDHISKAININDADTKFSALNNPNAKKHHLLTALDATSHMPFVANAIIGNKNCDNEVMEKGVMHKNVMTRMDFLKSRKMTPELFAKAKTNDTPHAEELASAMESDFKRKYSNE